MRPHPVLGPLVEVPDPFPSLADEGGASQPEGDVVATMPATSGRLVEDGAAEGWLFHGA